MISLPLVTIIIPSYNRATKVFEAIESAINQTYPYKQIVVVDDGSIDESKKVIGNYPEVEYFYKKNGGQASARNHGLKHAKGTLIASLDSDDIWHPDFLSRCVAKIEDGNFDFVFANWEQDAKIGNSWNFLAKDPFLKPYLLNERNSWVELNSEELRDLYLKSCPSPSSSVLIRRSSILSGWDEAINIGDDWCMYLELILSKKSSAAFTMDKLWRKRIDEINVYDGRKWSEILEFLYIADLKTKMTKFSSLLSTSELKILKKRYMEALVELSKHKLVREYNIGKTLKLLSHSFAVNVRFTLKTIPKVYMMAFERKMKRNKSKTT